MNNAHNITILIRALDKFFTADAWNRQNPDKINHERFREFVAEPLDRAWDNVSEDQKKWFMEFTQMHEPKYWLNNKEKYKCVCEAIGSNGIVLSKLREKI